MIAAIVERLMIVAARAGIRPLAGVGFLPVLHVERLHDDDSFARVLQFCRLYRQRTSARAIATVMTPRAPILAQQLAEKGFAEDKYRDRIAALGEFSDIGLHGHFLRSPETARHPVHNYWSDPDRVSRQIMEESHWLESHGLMHTRIYSAGWWHLDAAVLAALERNRFVFDFSTSVGKYNDSPVAFVLRRKFPQPVVFESAPGLEAAWAVSGICGSNRCSAVPRRTFAAFGASTRGPDRIVTLYSHDWDMDVASAMRTVEDLTTHGAVFPSLAELVMQRCNRAAARLGLQ